MKPLLGIVALSGTLLGCAYATQQMGGVATGPVETPITTVGNHAGKAGRGTVLEPEPGHELAAFAMGCFWGSETIFRHVPGVTATSVGYTGGRTENPTYEQVCSHTTGHAEAVLVEYDPKKVTYGQLLNVFWENHDPTSGNRQGPDVGDQYRSMIFALNDNQLKQAYASGEEFSKKLTRKLTTRAERLGPFYIAEPYHQQYHEKTGTAHCPFPKPPKKRGS